MSKENKMLIAFTRFMLEHGIECEEDIYQNDKVDEDSLELIEDLFNIVKLSNHSCDCQHNNNSKDSKSCCRCDNRQTNAEKIKNMSDEELADTLLNNCLEVMHIDKCNYTDNIGMCKQCIFEWLKSEAE